MTPLSFSAQTNDDRRAGQARGDCGRHMLGHPKSDYVSGRPILLLDRDSAGDLPLSRATSQALRFNSARLGLYHLNARSQFRWQAFADMARFRFHLNSLRSFVGFDAFERSERNPRSVPEQSGEFRNVAGS